MKPASNILPTLDLRKPLPLWAAIRHLMESDQVPAGSKPGLQSTAIDAVRYLLDTGRGPASREEALTTDIRPLMRLLPQGARRAAQQKTHRKPADHVRRAERFRDVILGQRTGRAIARAIECPEPWEPLVGAISGRRSELVFLYQCCVVLGEKDAPARMPEPEEILQGAEDIEGASGPPRARRAMVVYRAARRRLLEGTDGAKLLKLRQQFAPLRKELPPGTCHLGAERQTLTMIEGRRDRLEAEGLLSKDARAELLDPVEMTSEAMLRELFPELAADFDQWAVGSLNFVPPSL